MTAAPSPRARRTRASTAKPLTTADAPAHSISVEDRLTTCQFRPLVYFVAGTPTSVNRHYARSPQTQQYYVTPPARAWMETVWGASMPHRAAVQAIGAPLALTCRFIGGRADVDNLLKAVLDGCKRAFGIDDHWFTRVTAIRERRGKREAGVWITVESANEYEKAC